MDRNATFSEALRVTLERAAVKALRLAVWRKKSDVPQLHRTLSVGIAIGPKFRTMAHSLLHSKDITRQVPKEMVWQMNLSLLLLAKFLDTFDLRFFEDVNSAAEHLRARLEAPAT